ncbi:Mtc4p KNAG_0L01110 [Huiozyma naganishii CBS 8797]|uniref:Uncharacterized protein n=1 Tax=Huiozyma naganishii (strain ATCC MYA-139 / BCRC 22969 / CBS 8797 / KCTC 17520 / NBRC 10181 / NCYC 3082 / Yp74L-3) TaxID=1071383 RepID=J7SB44_HUIN7|nr:hypothetical protein KNAG_0L01110 [Kazachstania naganishii CBS 8797]CCK72731.1 hypothetical protein KNAG_0L01110 [Kazachstania naganishii CBS 8797]
MLNQTKRGPRVMKTRQEQGFKTPVMPRESRGGQQKHEHGQRQRPRQRQGDQGRVQLVTKLLVDNRYNLMDELNYGRTLPYSQGETGPVVGDDSVEGSRYSGAECGVAAAVAAVTATATGATAGTATSAGASGVGAGAVGAPSWTTQDQVSARIVHIPKSTRLKAERVRIYLEYFYNVMERCITLNDSVRDPNGGVHGGHGAGAAAAAAAATGVRYEGVEGVYNPLQVIRNRKLRKKYHDEVKPARELVFSRVPMIAVIQFSKRPTRNMRWFVKLSEKYSDLSWRTSHWDELRRPDGHLWITAEKQRDQQQVHIAKKKKKRRRHRLSQTIGKVGPKIPGPHGHGHGYDSNTVNLGNHLDVNKIPGQDEAASSSGTTIADQDGEYETASKFSSSRLGRLEKIITGKTRRVSHSRSPRARSTESGLQQQQQQQQAPVAASASHPSVYHLAPANLTVNSTRRASIKDATKALKELQRRDETQGLTEDKEETTTPEGSSDSKSADISVSSQSVSSTSAIPVTTGGTSQVVTPAVRTPITQGIRSTSPHSVSSRGPAPPPMDATTMTTNAKDEGAETAVAPDEAAENDESPGRKRKDMENEAKDQQRQFFVEELESLVDPASEKYVLPVDKQLEQYWMSTKYVMSTVAIMKHRRITHEIVKRKEIAKRNQIILEDDTDKNIEVANEVIQLYDHELDKVIAVGNKWASTLLNDYSIRVEMLISSSDRILSDINTTLTLKLKLFQENTERYGTIRMMRAQRTTRVAYRLLEYSIIGALWTIWLFVKMLREIRHGFVLTWKLIKWTIW